MQPNKPIRGLPWRLAVKDPPAIQETWALAARGEGPARHSGDMGSTPGLGRCPGEGTGNPLQYSCLGNLMDSRAWRATVHGVTKSRT